MCNPVITKDNVLEEVKKELFSRNLRRENIKSIIDELSNQSFNVQVTFYQAMIGKTQEEIAITLNVSQQCVSYYIDKNLQKIRNILNVSL